MMYRVNEIFYSIQGEGIRCGIPHVFARFAGCNLKCSFCDTDHVAYSEMTASEIWNVAQGISGECRNVCFTGGEPLLQLDAELLSWFDGWFIAVETNGTQPVPSGIDWVTCSPKGAQVLSKAHEWKCIIQSRSDPLPILLSETGCRLLSPVFINGKPDRDALMRCIELVKDNPAWRLTSQYHKFWGVR